jgi:hypothetical protein
MNLKPIYDGVELAVRLAALATAVAFIWRREPARRPVLLVALNALTILALNLLLLAPAMGIDFDFFRKAGLDVLDGLDPYAPGAFERHPFLNPPSALPLFAAFGLAPRNIGFAVWTALNLTALALLPAYALYVLNVRRGADEPPIVLSPEALLALTTALVVSDSALVGIYIGQLSVLTAVMIVAALHAQALRRPALAGLALAVATIKISTMLPFLLILFRRRTDLRTWIVLAAATLVLAAAPSGGLVEAVRRLPELVQKIGEMARPGMTNDYSYAGTENANIVGFDHALYRLGLRDRRVIGVVQLFLIAVFAGWVAWTSGRSERRRTSAPALVSLLAMVFLYHRNYDAVILAVPLVYATTRARSAEGRARFYYGAAATMILLLLYYNHNAMVALTRGSQHWSTAGRLLQAVLLPYATWFVLLSAAAIAAAVSREQSLTFDER